MEKFRDWYFDEEAATHALRFFNEYLHHSKGEWAGRPFRLEAWQAEIVASIFGWRSSIDGTRRYRTVYIEVPRKNGKSTLGAGIALYLTFADGEPGAEVYSAAADREQASIVFKEAAEMVRQCPELQEQCEVQTKAIVVPGTASVYRTLSREAMTKHGYNASGIIFDELHAQRTRDLWDVLTTSTGARRQPLTVGITTAGFDRNSICYELHDYAIKVRDGLVDDPTFLPVLFGADDDDDWTDPATWRKANPNLGVTIQESFLAKEIAKAKESPSYENTVRRLYLNQWTEQETRWISVSSWDACDDEREAEESLRDVPCFVGLDLSSTTDLTALVRVYPREDGFDIFGTFFAPAENIAKRSKRDRVPYEQWERAGRLVTTPGNVIDYEAIKAEIVRLHERGYVREVAYDPWAATQIAVQLEHEGVKCVPVRQGFASMSEPTKTFEKLILARKIRHGADPVLRWMVSNVTIEQDAAGNIKPSKAKSRERIDGVVAAIMALGRATVSTSDGRSVYRKRGLRVL